MVSRNKNRTNLSSLMTVVCTKTVERILARNARYVRKYLRLIGTRDYLPIPGRTQRRWEKWILANIKQERKLCYA